MVIQAVMQFDQGTDNRFERWGQVSRTLNASVSVGLDKLADMIVQDPNMSNYYIDGYTRYDIELRHFSVVLALSSHVGESVIFDLLSDDRLMMHLDSTESEAKLEVDWVGCLDSVTWVRLARVVGPNHSPKKVLHDCVEASMFAYCYINEKLIRHARSPPWDACVGDADEYLDKLKVAPKPHSRTSQRIQNCEVKGHTSRYLVKGGIARMRSASWSAFLAEKDHKGTAMGLRFHKTYGKEMLMRRAYIHNSVTQFMPQAPDLLVLHTQRRLEMYENKRPERISPWNVFCKHAWEASDDASFASAPLVKSERRNQVLSVAPAMWKTMDPEVQADFNREADMLRAMGKKEVAGEIAHLKAQLDMHAERQNSELETQTIVHKMSNVRFTDLEIAEMQTMFTDYTAFPQKIFNERFE